MRRLFATAALVLAATTLAFAQAAPPVRIRGAIVAIDATSITVNVQGTNSKIALADGYRVTLVVKSDLSKIVPGVYVGTAALPQADGTLVAQEVTIFPESSRGAGEGFRPYDLTPKSTMTNATVSTVATQAVDKVEGRMLLLKYKDGEKRVLVPPNVPIVTFVPGDKSALTVGAHVVFNATKKEDGSLSASSVSVGKDGLVPPN